MKKILVLPCITLLLTTSLSFTAAEAPTLKPQETAKQQAALAATAAAKNPVSASASALTGTTFAGSGSSLESSRSRKNSASLQSANVGISTESLTPSTSPGHSPKGMKAALFDLQYFQPASANNSNANLPTVHAMPVDPKHALESENPSQA